jgi:hypothetical protein
LLNSAHIRVKTGLKNSYAPRVPLLGIFERTRDLDSGLLLYKPKSVKKNIPSHFFYLICWELPEKDIAYHASQENYEGETA